MTINQAAYAAPVIPTGNSYVKVTSTDDITTGQYLIVYEDGETDSAVAFNGKLETLDAANNTIVVTIENNEIAATTATEAAEFTIDVTDDTSTIKSASGYYIGQTSDANGMNTSTETAYTNTISIDGEGNAVILASGGAYLRYNSASNQERFRYYKSASYTGQKAIQLYKKSQTVSISDAGMATFCSENALDFTGLTDMYAYIAQYNDGKVTYRKVTKVPARTGVLLRNPNGGATSQKVPVLTGAADDVEGNKFIGTLTEISSLPSDDGNNTNYILNNGENGVGFYKAAGKKVGAGKAYLQIPTPAVGTKVFIGFEETGEATGIENVNRETTTNGRCYNLNGQQVSGNYKGIVIVNGKKTIVK